MDKIIPIDIVIPCYNVENIIEKCLNSLLSQSYPNDKLHCYFINDSSTDKTKDILEKYSDHQNITIIHHKKNKGLSATRNTGVAAGDAEFIAFLDGDMTVKKDWIKSFLPYFNNNIIGVMGDNMPPSDNYPNGYKYKGETRNTSGWNTVVVAGKIIEKIGPILAINNLEASTNF